MKIRILSLMLAVCTLFACHGDLDIIQKSEVSANSMWQDESDALSAMYGLHNIFRGAFNKSYIFWGEYRTGLWGRGLATQTERDQVYQNQLTPDHEYASWEDLYTTINQANLILKYTPHITFTNEDTQNKVLANAYYVRAFCYYWIARLWGDAPILLDGFESDKQEGLFPTRDPVEDVFKQVEDDIQSALTHMPATVTDRNMSSRGAINMLKADYNLWIYKVRNGGADFLNQASGAISEVLNNSIYNLENNYADVFSDTPGNEIIHAWTYLQDEYTGGYPADYLVPSQYISEEAIENPVKVGSHQQWCFYTDAFKEILTENADDTRTLVNYEFYFDEPKDGTFQWINKYAGSWVNGTRIFDSDIIIYRYADALLFDAEIKSYQNDIPGAVASLNRIAERAYGIANFYPVTLTVTQLNEAILNERLKEFPAEGKLWWDYIRMGVAFEKAPYLIGRENEQNVLLWPVSSSSINKNPNLRQTPGYDK